MSEIDIEAVRRSVVQLRDADLAHDRRIIRANSILSALDQLAKENERLKAKLLESGEGANAVDQELGKVMRERDQAQAYNAQQDLVIDTLRTKLAAIQAAAAELAEWSEKTWSSTSLRAVARIAADFIRPHLPTPEPESADPLVAIAREMTLLDGIIRTDNQKAAIRDGKAGQTASEDFYHRIRAALTARGIELRKIGEGEARQFRSSGNG